MTEKRNEEEEEVCLRECSEKCKGGKTSVEEEESQGEAEKRGTNISEEESEDLGVWAEAGGQAGADIGESEYEREDRGAKSKDTLNDVQV